ncbi:hypothetical protein GCM10009087_11740 [Sphingomonas oligophenolica]|uniref:SMODS and SLOG-associating 2TM effector domain-containing protein n=1 Tax=Sphingomonas oligophenolica TaxID=301154 RepID=A0ABU9Y457_9SPHN
MALPDLLASLRGRRARGSTFEPIALDWKTLAEADFATFVPSLTDALLAFRDQRLAYYNFQRYARGKVTGVRSTLIYLGIIALMATALSSSIRLSGIKLPWWPNAGDHLLSVSLVCYVLMSAMSFWETATAGTQAYFRQLQVIMAIRDLWTQFEFDMIKALRDKLTGATSEEAAKTAIMTLAQTLVAAIDTLAQGELEQFRQEFQKSIASLQATGATGMDSLKQAIKDEVDKNLNDAKKAYATITVTGAVAPVQVILDDAQPFSSQSLSFTLPPVAPGTHRLQLSAKDAAGKVLEGSKYLDLPSGASTQPMAL